MLSYAWARLPPIKHPRTLEEWVRNQFGFRLFSIFFKTYTEKVWGISTKELSADWAAQRITGLDVIALVARVRRPWRGRGLFEHKEIVEAKLELSGFHQRESGTPKPARHIGGIETVVLV